MPEETTGKAKPQVTKAPPPPRELGGGGWIPPTPKTLTRPPDFPTYYPIALKLQTELLLTEAYRKFGTRAETVDLCKYVISGLSPHLCATVRDKTLRADLALRAMDDLIRCQVYWNSDKAERDGLLQGIKVSDEWLRFGQAIVSAGAEPCKAQPLEPSTPEAPDRQSSQGTSLGWQDIEISFFNEHTLVIRTPGGSTNFGFVELGFADMRGGCPNTAWKLLFYMARNGGRIPQPQPGKHKAKVQKPIGEIRKKLRQRYGIDADPIPFNGESYQASFKIGLAPSFAAAETDETSGDGESMANLIDHEDMADSEDAPES